jgi:hypothetical protein
VNGPESPTALAALGDRRLGLEGSSIEGSLDRLRLTAIVLGYRKITGTAAR